MLWKVQAVMELSPIYGISHCAQFSAACRTPPCQQAHMPAHASAQSDQGRARDLQDHHQVLPTSHIHIHTQWRTTKVWAGGGLYQMAALLFHCYAQRGTCTHPYLHTQMHPQTCVCSVGTHIHRQTHTHTHKHSKTHLSFKQHKQPFPLLFLLTHLSYMSLYFNIAL